MRVNSRTMLIIAAVLAGVWLLMYHHGKMPLPWNVGQAGQIFSGLQGGGGQ